MTRPIITLTTDFGVGSAYVAQMKGVILSINRDATIVDVTHSVKPQDVRAGALVLSDVAPRFPAGTIHVAVVDPGVGTSRRIVCARLIGQCFIAPDNGLLGLLVERHGREDLFEVANPKYHSHPVSSTFHGRDIMAPAAAHLSCGVPASDLGPPLDSLICLPRPRVSIDDHRIVGEILMVDSFGNLISNIEVSTLFANDWPRRASVMCKGSKVDACVRAYGEAAPGAIVALFGSSSRLEVAAVNGSAADVLKANPGDSIVLEWSGE